MPPPPRSRTWTRLRLHIFHDAHSVALDVAAESTTDDATRGARRANALLMRLATACYAVTDPTQRVSGQPMPGAAWLLADNGAPLSIRHLARRTRLTDEEARAALDAMREAELLLISDAGAFGVADIASVTESPNAERVRASRERRRQTEAAGAPALGRPRIARGVGA